MCKSGMLIRALGVCPHLRRSGLEVAKHPGSRTQDGPCRFRLQGDQLCKQKSLLWTLRQGQARALLEGRAAGVLARPPPRPLSPLLLFPLHPSWGDPARPGCCVRSEVTPPPAWFRNEDRPVVSEGQDKSHTLGASRTTQPPDLLGASLAPGPRSTKS